CAGFQLDQFQRQLVREALAVFGEALGHPAGHALPDSHQARAHDGCPTIKAGAQRPRSPSLPVGARGERPWMTAALRSEERGRGLRKRTSKRRFASYTACREVVPSPRPSPRRGEGEKHRPPRTGEGG